MTYQRKIGASFLWAQLMRVCHSLTTILSIIKGQAPLLTTTCWSKDPLSKTIWNDIKFWQMNMTPITQPHLQQWSLTILPILLTTILMGIYTLLQGTNIPCKAHHKGVTDIRPISTQRKDSISTHPIRLTTKMNIITCQAKKNTKTATNRTSIHTLGVIEATLCQVLICQSKVS